MQIAEKTFGVHGIIGEEKTKKETYSGDDATQSFGPHCGYNFY